MPQLEAIHLQLSYGHRPVIEDVSLRLPDGKVTMIVGANGSGKSTLLRGLSRLLRPSRGTVVLDGADIHRMSSKALARQLGLLPQSPSAPEGVTVRELVSRGRHPHQGMFGQRRHDDEHAIAEALELTRTSDLADRVVDELSGGQRQRVWIAMVLAQRTDILLLDEPTTYLDVAHQLEVLDVVRELNRARGVTVAIVLHDLNMASRYGDHMVAVADGGIRAEGTPFEVLTEARVREVFDLDARIIPDPLTGTPMVIPVPKDGGTP